VFDSIVRDLGLIRLCARARARERERERERERRTHKVGNVGSSRKRIVDAAQVVLECRCRTKVNDAAIAAWNLGQHDAFVKVCEYFS